MNNVVSSIRSDSFDRCGNSSQFLKSKAGHSAESSNRTLLRTAASLASLMAASTTASAQEGGVQASQLPTIDVSGNNQGGYQATQQSITRLQTPLLDTPQTINMVPAAGNPGAAAHHNGGCAAHRPRHHVQCRRRRASRATAQSSAASSPAAISSATASATPAGTPAIFSTSIVSKSTSDLPRSPSAGARPCGAINNVSKLPTGATFVEGTASPTSVGGYRADVDAQRQARQYFGPHRCALHRCGDADARQCLDHALGRGAIGQYTGR